MRSATSDACVRPGRGYPGPARALTAGRHAPELPELPLQYPDYAVWLQDLAQRDKFGADLDYWRGVLGDE
ncbi:hypothetical protein, partial [Nocardia brasiliensis]|uniref:hypothetical protein n=1 Tax=Nocardia brasiliensis TaxID=37326 RepID=UPI0024553227